MRKTSQDGGDSTSITSGIENELKKPVGIMKTKRNSIKRKVQTFSQESDDAIIEPLLQKEKGKTDIQNQSAKYLLSKTKTDSTGEKESDKEKLLSSNKFEKPSLSTAPSVVESKNLINGTKENHIDKSYSTTIHNHMNTNVFVSIDGAKNIVSPKSQILVEIDGSKQSGYNPSPLIFTTAKIHADGKAKHMEPVHVTPVPILSTIEGSVVKAASISDNQNKILPTSAGKTSSVNAVYRIPYGSDSKIRIEQRSPIISALPSEATSSGVSRRLSDEKLSENITDLTTMPIKTIKAETHDSQKQIPMKLSKSSDKEKSDASCTVTTNTSTNAQSSIDVNKNIEYGNVSDKKPLSDRSCNIRQMQYQNNAIVVDSSDASICLANSNILITNSNTIMVGPSITKSSILLTNPTTTTIQTTELKGISSTSTDKSIIACSSPSFIVTKSPLDKSELTSNSVTSKLMSTNQKIEVQPTAAKATPTLLTSEISTADSSGKSSTTTISSISESSPAQKIPNVQATAIISSSTITPYMSTTNSTEKAVTTTVSSTSKPNPILSPLSKEDKSSSTLASTIFLSTQGKVLSNKPVITTVTAMEKSATTKIPADKSTKISEALTTKTTTTSIVPTGKTSSTTSVNKSVATTTVSGVTSTTTTVLSLQKPQTINSTTKVTTSSISSPVNTMISTLSTFKPALVSSKPTLSDSSTSKSTSIISPGKTAPNHVPVSLPGNKSSSTFKPAVTNDTSTKTVSTTVKTMPSVTMTSSVSSKSSTDLKKAILSNSVTTIGSQPTKIAKSAKHKAESNIYSERPKVTTLTSNLPVTSSKIPVTTTVQESDSKSANINTTQTLDANLSKTPLVTKVSSVTTSLTKQTLTKPTTTKSTISTDTNVKSLVNSNEKPTTKTTRASTSNKQNEKCGDDKKFKA